MVINIPGGNREGFLPGAKDKKYLKFGAWFLKMLPIWSELKFQDTILNNKIHQECLRRVCTIINTGLLNDFYYSIQYYQRTEKSEK